MSKLSGLQKEISIKHLGRYNMDKYFVVIGHITSDNYNEPPHYQIRVLPNKEAVLSLYKEWLNPEESGSHEDCSECIFRVFQGSELNLVAKEKVVAYELK